MNPRITKLRAEREKNTEKIAKLNARNEEIDQEVAKLENLEIIGLVRGCGMTPEQLAAVLRGNSPIPAPAAVTEGEEGESHESA